ncbi:hypothetical protein IV203_025974 [Nitzschia inconspicua]|uniref:Uncharacterized protein n=1 Tax=Nitzschia inconspicua TaxID=303405 RepID=A0A9K3PWJ6_9STRA|nr:hypothetical protein IV203_025974 [Nitzschia inconspicua]
MSKNAATKSSFEVPTRHFDKNGKITNWSMRWPEAKELEVLVLEVCLMLDGMKPAEVMKQYSERLGSKFGYKPCSSGLMNIRKKHNKELSERNKHADNDGEC